MIEELREKLFFDIAVKKEFKERIQFEFSNYKKRMYGLNRFSHGCDVVLNTNILISFSQFIEILTGDGDKEYYVISFDYLDGIIMDKQQCLNYLSISSTANLKILTIIITANKENKTIKNVFIIDHPNYI